LRIARRDNNSGPSPIDEPSSLAVRRKQEGTTGGHRLEDLGRQCPLKDGQVAKQDDRRIGPRVQARDLFGGNAAEHLDVVMGSFACQRSDSPGIGAVAGDRDLHDPGAGYPGGLNEHIESVREPDGSGKQHL
jgi:hypothetical protein